MSATIHIAREQMLLSARFESAPDLPWTNSSRCSLGMWWAATPITITKLARKTVSAPAALTPSVSIAAGQSVFASGSCPCQTMPLPDDAEAPDNSGGDSGQKKPRADVLLFRVDEAQHVGGTLIRQRPLDVRRQPQHRRGEACPQRPRGMSMDVPG